MQLSRIREGDEVECIVNGRIFAAVAGVTEKGRLHITPLNPRVTYTSVTARQVEKILKNKKEERA